MQQYSIHGYQKGFEEDQVRIGQEVARNWIWPYAYDLPDLLKLHARPDFDPSTRHYCFLGTEMVGYIFSVITPAEEGTASTAYLDFPRMLPGHEHAAELMIEQAIDTLMKKGVSRIVGRVTTMVPGDIHLAERAGFSISDWGHKVYYTYEMKWGKLTLPASEVVEMDPHSDLDDCARIATHWYGRPLEWCRSLLEEWHQAGLIAHLGVREAGNLVAACMVAPNTVRASTAAIYYIYSPDEKRLRPMLARVVDRCIDFGTQNVIADLVNEHRQYEPVYQELGFKKVAEWARCEMALAGAS